MWKDGSVVARIEERWFIIAMDMDYIYMHSGS